MLTAAAGLLEGLSEGGPSEAAGFRSAALCRAAGADPDLIPEWIAEERRVSWDDVTEEEESAAITALRSWPETGPTC